MSDPLASVAVAAPDADPNSRTAVQDRARALIAQAMEFAVGENLTGSPYASMPPGALFAYAQQAGRIVDQLEDGNQRVWFVAELAQHMDPVQLRAVLVLLDAQNKEAGRPLIYVAPVEPALAVTPAPKLVQPPSFLPPSPSGKYVVVERKNGVSLPGGVYTISEGAEYDIKSMGRDALEEMARQGVKLRPDPDTAMSAGDRATCRVCQTSWLLIPYEGRNPLGGCPACYLLEQIRAAAGDLQEELEDAQARARSAERSVAALEAESGEAGRAIAEEQRAHERTKAKYDMLVLWAMEQGAAAPGDDGTWQGESHPPPLVKISASTGPSGEAAAEHIARAIGESTDGTPAHPTPMPPADEEPVDLGDIATPPPPKPADDFDLADLGEAGTTADATPTSKRKSRSKPAAS